MQMKQPRKAHTKSEFCSHLIANVFNGLSKIEQKVSESSQLILIPTYTYTVETLYYLWPRCLLFSDIFQKVTLQSTQISNHIKVLLLYRVKFLPISTLIFSTYTNSPTYTYTVETPYYTGPRCLLFSDILLPKLLILSRSLYSIVLSFCWRHHDLAFLC